MAVEPEFALGTGETLRMASRGARNMENAQRPLAAPGSGLSVRSRHPALTLGRIGAMVPSRPAAWPDGSADSGGSVPTRPPAG